MHCVSTNKTFSPQRKNLSSVIRGIKSAITQFARKQNIPFVWQARFHDHIIRDREQCNSIAEYIENNLALWDTDEYR